MSVDGKVVAKELVALAKELAGAWSVSRPGEVLMLRDFPTQVRNEILSAVDRMGDAGMEGYLRAQDEAKKKRVEAGLRELKGAVDSIMQRHPGLERQDVETMILDIYHVRMED